MVLLYKESLYCCIKHLVDTHWFVSPLMQHLSLATLNHNLSHFCPCSFVRSSQSSLQLKQHQSRQKNFISSVKSDISLTLPFPGHNILNKYATILLKRMNQIETPKLLRNQSKGKHRNLYPKPPLKTSRLYYKNTATQTLIFTTEFVVQKKNVMG